MALVSNLQGPRGNLEWVVRISETHLLTKQRSSLKDFRFRTATRGSGNRNIRNAPISPIKLKRQMTALRDNQIDVSIIENMSSTEAKR
jgi:hypothetical protein